MSMDKKPSVNTAAKEQGENGQQIMIASAPGGMNIAKQTLFARITTGKQSILGTSGGMDKTAATSNVAPSDVKGEKGDGGKQNLSLGSTFRDVLKKGVVSGAGMLTC